MKRAATLIIVWSSIFCGLFSQKSLDLEGVTPVNHATLVGIGKAYLYDTYLSPLT